MPPVHPTPTPTDALSDQPADWLAPEEGPPPSERPDGEDETFDDDDGQPDSYQERQDFAQDEDWGRFGDE